MLYAITAAAARLGISRSRLYVELGAGRIRAVKVGRRTLIRDDELARYATTLPTAQFREPGARHDR